MFDYTVGETLSFSVGAVQLGTLPDGKPLVTPNDFGAATENIARFLQTLDADGEHINGIDGERYRNRRLRSAGGSGA